MANPLPQFPQLIGYALVAPKLKIMYVPTTKVACSSIKLLLSLSEGSYNQEATKIIITPNISQEQTIHNYRVHGLTRFFDLSEKEQWHIITSPEWIRIATLRDPLARAYSSWENRVFLRSPGTPAVIIERSPDVLVAGKIDLAASFKNFAQQFALDNPAFMIDDHFRPQFNTIYRDQIDYTYTFQVDKPGEMDRLAQVLNDRSGKSYQPERLNSGLGIKPVQVYDRETANIMANIYSEDFRWFDFEPHQFIALSVSLPLDPLQAALLRNLRETTERLTYISRSAFSRVGFRYGLSQLRKSLWIRITNPKAKGDTRLLQW
ncbi:MAG: sulfotransferase family 2 domain-containing protein [Ilumatobacteraceae bacterium]